VQATALFGIFICLSTFNHYIPAKWTSWMTCGKSE
jgi:hypothetical protein